MTTLRRALPLLALAALGCARAEAQPPAPAAPPPRVVFGTGTLEADRTAPLAFERPGTLREVAVTVGDIIEPGSVVARLDDRDSALSVRRERAALLAERATLTRLHADERLLGERARIARREADRAARLYDVGSGSGLERDRGEDGRAVSGLELSALRAQRPGLVARAAQAESRLALARWTLDRDVLRAPARARVLRCDYAPGAFVGAGHPVAVLAPLGAEVAAVWVHESELSAVRVGAAVSVVLRDGARTRLAGTVRRVRPEADGRNHEARVDVSLSSLPGNVVFGVRLDAEITRSAAP